MPLKFETKEKFHVITVDEPELTASLSATLQDAAESIRNPSANQAQAVRNLILVMSPVQRIDKPRVGVR